LADRNQSDTRREKKESKYVSKVNVKREKKKPA
jgi:hypothetical protein